MATLPPLICDELPTTTRSVRKRFELAAYVQEHVPKFADGSKVRAAFAKRDNEDTDHQSACFDWIGLLLWSVGYHKASHGGSGIRILCEI